MVVHAHMMMTVVAGRWGATRASHDFKVSTVVAPGTPALRIRVNGTVGSVRQLFNVADDTDPVRGDRVTDGHVAPRIF